MQTRISRCSASSRDSCELKAAAAPCRVSWTATEGIVEDGVGADEVPAGVVDMESNPWISEVTQRIDR
jgi:hypothetical protein